MAARPATYQSPPDTAGAAVVMARARRVEDSYVDLVCEAVVMARARRVEDSYVDLVSEAVAMLAAFEVGAVASVM